MDSDTESIFSSIVILSVLINGCAGACPGNLGVRDGRLAPCPATLNCVSSQSADREHAIEPLQFTGPVADAHAGLKKIVLSMKRSAIITETEKYIHAEFTSAFWRFVDDGEFWFDADAHVIHMRSASRIGQSDFGVNRKRLEEISARWKATGR